MSAYIKKDGITQASDAVNTAPDSKSSETPLASLPSNDNGNITSVNDSIHENDGFVNTQSIEERAVQAAYEAGRAGLEMKDVSLETNEQQDAFVRGKREYIMNMPKAKSNHGYGTNGAKAFDDIVTSEKTNESELKPKFQRAYEAGFMGAENNFTDSVEQRAYEAGKADSAESLNRDIENSKQNPVVSKNGGLVRNKASQKVSRTEQELMDELGKLLGVKIKYAEQVYGGKANGSYKDGNITIALDAENKLIVVGKHEITHYLKEVSPEEYFAFRNYAVQALSEGRGSTAITLVEETQAKAKSTGVNLTVEEAMDEIACDFTENLLTNEADLRAFLESMSETKQKRNVMQKFFDAIRHFLESIKNVFNGNKAKMDEATQSEFGATVEQLEKAELLWKDALAATAEKVKTTDTSMKAQKNTDTESGVQYSLKRNAKGEKYWEIDSGKDIFKGLKTKEEYQDAAYNYLIGNRDNNIAVEDNDGNKITFIRLSAEEFTNSEESKQFFASDPETYKKKMRMLPSLQDILLNTSVEWDSPDFKNHKLFKERGFKNYRSKVKVDNVIFNTIVRVGKAKFGNIFYDINLEVDTILPHTKGASEIKNVPTSNNNISKNNPVVKENFSAEDGEAKYSLKGLSDLLAENKKLREVNAELRVQFEVTKAAKVDEKALDKFTKDLLKEYNSESNASEVKGALDELFTYIANGEDGNVPIKQRSHPIKAGWLLMSEMKKSYQIRT